MNKAEASESKARPKSASKTIAPKYRTLEANEGIPVYKAQLPVENPEATAEVKPVEEIQKKSEPRQAVPAPDLAQQHINLISTTGNLEIEHEGK